MQINNRIKKLERETFATGIGEFCPCPGVCSIVVIEPDLDKSEADRNREREERMKSKLCDLCGKQIEQRIIEVLAV